MKSKLLSNAFAAAFLGAAGITPGSGQGALDPPGPPAPTQKSLQQIWDKIGLVQEENDDLHRLVTVLTEQLGRQEADLTAGFAELRRRADAQEALATMAAEASGVEFPWHVTTAVQAPALNWAATLAATPEGDLAMVFAVANDDGINRDIAISVFDGGQWSDPDVVDTLEIIRGQLQLGFDRFGRAVVAYSDGTKLFCATRNGAVWHQQTIDEPCDDLSLVIGPDGLPHIAYGKADELKFARRGADESWVTRVIHSEPGARVSAPDLAYSQDGNPWIGFLTREGGSADLHLADLNIAAPSTDLIASDVSFAGPSVAVSPSGVAAVGYAKSGKIVLANLEAPTGLSSITLAQPHVETDSRIPIAFAPDGNLAFAYWDIATRELVHAKIVEGVPQSQDVTTTSPEHSVQSEAIQLAYSPSGQPAITYPLSGAGGSEQRYAYRGLVRRLVFD